MQLCIKKSLLIFVMIPALFLMGCGDKFDPVAYTRAILDLSFQGDVSEALKVEKNAEKDDLEASYYEFVSEFVQQNITADMQMEDLTETKFTEVTMDIFSILRYNVLEGEKTGKDEYSVKVKVNPVDTFTRFKEYSEQDALKIKEKVESGGYEGTKEEINAQVLADIYNHSYELLYSAYTETKYLDPVTVTLKITKKNDSYEIDAKDMNQLINEIFCFN